MTRLYSSQPGAIANPPASENQGPFQGPTGPPDIGYAEGVIRLDGSIVLADALVSDSDLSAALLNVEQLVVASFGNVAGPVQLTMGGGNAYYSGFNLTAATQFTVINAVFGGILALGITAFNGFAATPPPGTSWVANTAPPSSAGPDLWVFVIDDPTLIASPGVPSLLRGQYSQGYGPPS